MLSTPRKFFGLVVFAAVAAPCSAQLQYSCFGGTAGNCSRFVGAFCNTLNGVSVNPGDIVSRCFNAGNGQRCDLLAVNTVGTTGSPSVTNCINGLNTISATCPSGGFGKFQGGTFEFVTDPNTGSCGIPGGN
ncbi:TMV resistance protein Y3 [Mycena latifolia]|nr:TMV resistance protein Y3 [Mycena latifolia]